jgi:hypothetical protein
MRLERQLPCRAEREDDEEDERKDRGEGNNDRDDTRDDFPVHLRLLG